MLHPDGSHPGGGAGLPRGSHCDDGRGDQRALVGLRRRRGRDHEQLPRAAGSERAAGPVQFPLYRSRLARLVHRGGREPGDNSRLTPVPRAVQQLGITLIPAYSPQARGRSERVFRPRPDRRPKEVALVGITDRAAANQYRGTQVLPASNRRVAGPAADTAPPSSRGSGRTAPRSSVCTRSGSSPTITPYAIRAGVSRSRPIRTGSLM